MRYGDSLDYSQPIARGHPLNRGLVAEWAVVLWYASGPRLIDLSGFSNHGTLTGGPTWGGALGRPGGSGAVVLDGTDDHVVLPTALAVAPFTVAGWMRATTGDYRPLFSKSAEWFVGWDNGNTANFRDHSGGNFYPGTKTNDGGWHFHVLACAGNGVGETNHYIDGVLSSNGRLSSTTGAVAFYAGRDTTLGKFVPGSIDSLTYHARALSAAEALALYDESRRGNPSRWNWVTGRAWAFGVTAAAATGAFVLARGRTGIILAGR